MNNPLFAKELRRLDLLALPKNAHAKKIKVAVYRNHSFEVIAGVLNAFLNDSDLKAEFVYSSYDDSLNFQVQPADLQIIWLDINRYNTGNINDFLADRIAFLRNDTSSPILLFYIGKKIDFKTDVPDVFIFHVDDDIAFLKEAAYDEAKEPYSGTRLSSKASLEIARMLGLKYITAVVKTPLKAIVVDMDNTLYKGVLGEDGIKGVIPNTELQQQLKNFKNDGFFLCIASKNEESDARKLFTERKDFLLTWDDFTAVEINWKNKADNLQKLAKTLNIGVDAILFIDDNPAEVLNVEHIGIKTLLADDNICQILKYYPGLLKLRKNNEDTLRSADVKANAQRAEMLKKLTPEQYFKKLGINLTYGINRPEQIPRIAELFGKTNQFILTYKRYKETEVTDFMNDPNSLIITVKMADNLSDSGIIAILAAHRDGDDLILDEMTVSCRALGRNLEDIMLPKMFELAADELLTKKRILIHYKEGERNTPALSWLAKIAGIVLQSEGCISYDIPNKINTDGLKIEVLR